MRADLLAFALLLTISNARAGTICQSDGNCPECDVGECKAVATATVTPGQYSYTDNPSCMNGVDGAQDVANALQSGAMVYLADYAGAVDDLLKTSQAQQFISDNVHGSIGQALSGNNRATAQCKQLCVVIPAKATYTSYQLEAADDKSGGGQKCEPGAECPIGWSKWDGEPDQSQNAKTQVICGTFMNWSGDRWRYASLTAYFKPAANWVRQK